MRLFLGLELASATADEIHSAIGPMRDAEPALAWVSARKLHLTLKFLGEGDESRVAALIVAADRVAAAHRPFEMDLGGVGAFPNFRRPRVVWLGVAREPRLELLHHDVELAAADLGYEVEGRPFRPHVTLARVRAPLPPPRARTLARAARAVSYSATTFVDRLTLFDSTAAGAAAHYRCLHTAALGGR